MTNARFCSLNIRRYPCKVGIQSCTIDQKPELTNHLYIIAALLDQNISQNRKLAKILVGIDVMDQLRFPADDLSRKIFNINLAIRTFKEAGTAIVTYSGDELDISQIPWGHREKTLSLLWCILSRHHIDAVIERGKLIREIEKLGESVPTTLSSKELLLAWVRGVCQVYNMQVADLADFNDGRALGLLVHHYLPEHLKLAEIRQHTPSTAISHRSTLADSVLSDNLKSNFRTCFTKVLS